MWRIHIVVALADRAQAEAALTALTGEPWSLQTATPAVDGFPAADPYPGAAWASPQVSDVQALAIEVEVLRASPTAVVERGAALGLEDPSVELDVDDVPTRAQAEDPRASLDRAYAIWRLRNRALT